MVNRPPALSTNENVKLLKGGTSASLASTVSTSALGSSSITSAMVTGVMTGGWSFSLMISTLMFAIALRTTDPMSDTTILKEYEMTAS